MDATSGESSKLLASGACAGRAVPEIGGLGSTSSIDNGTACDSTDAFPDEKPVSTMGITCNV